MNNLYVKNNSLLNINLIVNHIFKNEYINEMIKRGDYQVFFSVSVIIVIPLLILVNSVVGILNY